MNEIDDGGSAFPGLELFEDRFVEAAGKTETVKAYSVPGMTLRDYFAGQALAGFLPNNDADLRGIAEVGGAKVAAFVYSIADAMLAERKKAGE